MRLLRTWILLLLSTGGLAACSGERQATPANTPPAAVPAPAATRPAPAKAPVIPGSASSPVTATGQTVSGGDYRVSAERALLDGRGAIRADVAQATLDTGRFDLSLLYLAEQTGRNREARELSSLYADHIRRQLAPTPQAKLDILTCGDSLCLGRIQTDDSEAFRQWFARFERDPATPHYAWVETLIHMQSGVREHRFIFSTDPAVQSLRASEPGTRAKR